MITHVEIGQRIGVRRKDLGLTLTEVASEVGVAASTIQRYEKGQFDKIKMPVIEAIAAALSVNPDWLIGNTEDPVDYDDGDLMASIPLSYMKLFDGDVQKAYQYMQAVDDENLGPGDSNFPLNAIPYNEPHLAPVVGTIPAGYPVLALEDIEGYASISYHDVENYFFLRVQGDSMINAGIQSGDLVLIRKQSCADDGQIVAARVNGDEATLKRFKQQGDTVLLLPENPAYEPRIVPAIDFETGEAQVIGVAVEVRHMF